MNSSTSHSSSDRLRQILTVAAIFGSIGVNALSNIVPPGGQTIGEIANTQFADLRILPANYAFAIWGLIYIGLIAFGFYQLRPDQRQNPVLRRVDYALIVACVAQAIWVYLFLAGQFWLSVVAMLAILISLIASYLWLGVGLRPVSRREKWSAHLPFGVYLGWISVATIVNVASALDASGWNGGGIAPEVWAIGLAIVAAGLAVWVLLTRSDFSFPGVIVWALVAVAVRQAAFASVSITAIGLVIGLLVLIGIQWAQRRTAR
jgi:hypothetical protein